MSMNQSRFSTLGLIILLSFVISGCEQKTQEAQEPELRPVRTMLVDLGLRDTILDMHNRINLRRPISRTANASQSTAFLRPPVSSQPEAVILNACRWLTLITELCGSTCPLLPPWDSTPLTFTNMKYGQSRQGTLVRWTVTMG